MTTIPNFTGRRVTVKATGYHGVIKETKIAPNADRVISVKYLVETDTGTTIEVRPDEVQIDVTK